MPSDTIIITGADSRYAPLMRELILSLRKFPRSAEYDLGVLDCGLDAGDQDWCRSQGASIVEPAWDVTFGPGMKPAPTFRAMTARPHLRRYFPGYEIYVWLDADVWVQDWSSIRLLREACRIGDIALVPEVHRSYRNFRDGRDEYEAANGGAYAEAFGVDTAARLIRRPLNNAGVFAIGASSPAWTIWADRLADAARRSTNMIDQIALNVAIYDNGVSEVRLPAVCNWIAHLATPAWHSGRHLFVDPDPPHDVIGILHLTLATKWEPAVDVLEIGEDGRAVTPGRAALRSLRFPI
ncbi:MAG: hypothetical protein AB7L90_22670 [Hyphomicrobiaceae bacterium]